MIKLLAAIFMIIDHIGYIFFPDIIIFRVIGRLSMPLFAYCIVRGYEYSRQKGTIKKYFRNLVIFTVVSQLPFYLMAGEGINIGGTWIFSLLLLVIRDKINPKLYGQCIKYTCLGIVLLDIAYLLKVDYGIYGALMPLAMRSKNKRLLYMIVLWAMYVWLNGAAGLLQVFSCAVVPLLALVEPQDNKVRLPKQFYYVFYPLHILILLAIKMMI